ncbi:MAG: MaoC family dehydratase [Rhodospirillaceae bacterium]|jgi:3-hydroxybutyryl-CoA dehydratase
MASIDELEVGQTAAYERTVTAEDIEKFAEISGDDNPVHLDEDFANKTLFKGRIAHGMLAASFISTTVGTKLPGYGAIYISQNLRFKAPVRIGDTVVTTATIQTINTERKRVIMSTVCSVDDKIVVEGEAELMLT